MRIVNAMLVSVVLVMCGVARGERIDVQPGEGTISAALARASAGDTLALAPGEYRDSFTVPGGVVIGATGGPGSVRLVGTGMEVLRVAGARVGISGIEFVGSAEDGKALRGVFSKFPVRIEQCRFTGLVEGVVLETAPLSDVVRCEFVNCTIGIAATRDSSPTIWGCVFRGTGTGESDGRVGVSAEGGMPFVSNSLFSSVRTGVRLGGARDEIAVVRNNVFVGCADAGVDGRRSAGEAPAIRNNVFASCGAAVVGDAEFASRTSHDLVMACGEQPFVDARGAVTVDLADRTVMGQARGIVTEDPGLNISETGRVGITNRSVVEGEGRRKPWEAPGEVGTIGFEAEGFQPGIPEGESAAAGPNVRWYFDSYVANSEQEIRQFMKMAGFLVNKPARERADGKMRYSYRIKTGDQVQVVQFDVSRFYGESSLD